MKVPIQSLVLNSYEILPDESAFLERNKTIPATARILSALHNIVKTREKEFKDFSLTFRKKYFLKFLKYVRNNLDQLTVVDDLYEVVRSLEVFI